MLRQVGRTIDAILNPDGERRLGFVLVVAPIAEPPVKAEILMNVTTKSARVVLLEGVARLEGRVVEKGGTA
jgi:hypothetical protein